MLEKIKTFLLSENGGEGSQTGILIALGSVVAIGILTYAGTKIKGAVDAGGSTLDNASSWSYGAGAKTK
ncbi:hypothetical protein [Desulfotruncus alcoholivorax]|uniref:hypothetical protein n=1 Tax=Desulfotruncus alcoholivorax TaxID=265477 RepID=UPI0003FAB93D|nr:hypothetical protein [Desulfotruncus alcoholivorax]